MDKRARLHASEGRTQSAGVAGSTASWGQLLRRYRTLAGLTQEELAERSGYSVHYVSMLERDLRHPPLVAVERLTEALGLGDTERDDLRTAHQRRGAAELHTGPRPLAGRDGERAEIQRQLVGLGPPVLLLAGEPGIGKTRLLEDAISRASQGGWRVLHGSCRRSAQDSYAPLTDALAHSIQQLPEQSRRTALQGADWLGLLLPELARLGMMDVDGSEGTTGRHQATLGPEQERRLLFAAVARYLRAVAGEAGTLLVLDDLHWAGADALDLLAALVTSPQPSPIQVLGAYRDTELPADSPLAGLIADLARASLVRILSVGPLSEATAEQLLVELVRGDERQQALLPAIVRRAGGVPFFLVNFAEDLRRHDAEPSLQLPWTVTQVIRQRVVALPDPVRELLDVTAVVGRAVPRSLLSQLTGRDEEEVLTGLEAAAAARLLEEDEEGYYRFTHDLIQESIETDLSASRRQLLHRRIGETLEQDERASTETLAYHFARSDDPVKALHSLERAGDEAEQRFAHAAAASFFQEAVTRRVHAGQPLETAPLQEKLGRALYLAGRYDVAITVLERALAVYQTVDDEEGVQRVAGRLGEVHFRRGTGHDALAHVAALAQDDVLNPADGGSRGAISLREGLIRLLFGKGAYSQVLTAGHALARVGRATGNARIRSMGDRAEGVALIGLGRLAEGIGVLEPALARGLGDGDRERVAEVAILLCGAHFAMGSLDRCEVLSRQMLRLAESLNDPVLIAAHTVLLGGVSHVRGEWEQARVYLKRADELIETAGPSFVSVGTAPVRAPCFIWEGQWEEARAYLKTNLELARSMRYRPSEHHAIFRLAELELLEGQPQVAIAQLEPLVEGPLEWSSAVPLLSTLVRAFLEVDDVARAVPLADRAVAEARRMGTWLEGIAALRMQGIVAARLGNFDTARGAYEEGVQRARSIPFPFGEAHHLHAYGLLEAQQGNHAASAIKLADALAIFERLGATKEIQRLRLAVQTH